MQQESSKTENLSMYSDVRTDFSISEMIVNYAPMVKRIAVHLVHRLPASIQRDDLIQAGMIGLLEAIKNYDITKGASFETYASIRIRGTMLDEVRRGDWVPRSVHRNTRLVADKIRVIENRTGRDARDHEVAQELGVSVSEYHQMLIDSTSCHLFTLDDLLTNRDNLVDTEGLTSTLPEPYEKANLDSLREILVKSIATLPERERLVLALYYDEDLNLKEIGDVLGVSESRISQIHGQAMLRLQSRVEKGS